MFKTEVKTILEGHHSITAALGEVPVIPPTFEDEAMAAAVINFLRAGAPAVQVLFGDADSEKIVASVQSLRLEGKEVITADVDQEKRIIRFERPEHE